MLVERDMDSGDSEIILLGYHYTLMHQNDSQKAWFQEISLWFKVHGSILSGNDSFIIIGYLRQPNKQDK
jgi:hypothetical protein